MGSELLVVLEYIEREKGVDRGVIVAAIESALLSAAKKRFGEECALSVTISAKTGDISVTKDGAEVRSGDFGRIAAQTARQIITQRIREAEREVMFNDFQTKIGEITNGIVHRFERGNIIIDLGKAEGMLPFRETLPKEEFRQGERVRALIIDVKKSGKGPQIILSRTNSGFVRRLFELEVPEIYEGLVEIKDISRQAGDRTKVAVSSRDEKVDCVGACVGVRGSRIKNIVHELRGEKVDIVRWSTDVVEYVRAAMSPAKVGRVSVNQDEKRVDIDVEEDQLSLAIGKKGQNIRLASKLTGWNINILGREADKVPAPEEDVAIAVVAGAGDAGLEELPGVGDKTRAALLQAGFTTTAAIAASSVKDLTLVKGIGKKKAEQVIEAAKQMMTQEGAAGQQGA